MGRGLFTGGGCGSEGQHDGFIDYSECSEIARMLTSRFENESDFLAKAREKSDRKGQAKTTKTYEQERKRNTML